MFLYPNLNELLPIGGGRANLLQATERIRRSVVNGGRAGRTVFCPVDGSGRRPAAGRRRSLPGRASEPARAKEPIVRFPVQLCFVSKYNSEQSPFP